MKTVTNTDIKRTSFVIRQDQVHLGWCGQRQALESDIPSFKSLYHHCKMTDIPQVTKAL